MKSLLVCLLLCFPLLSTAEDTTQLSEALNSGSNGLRAELIKEYQTDGVDETTIRRFLKVSGKLIHGGHPADAVPLLEYVVANRHENRYYWLSLAKLYLHTSLRKARYAAWQSISYSTYPLQKSQAYQLIGDAWQKNGEDAKAIAAWQLAVNEIPDVEISEKLEQLQQKIHKARVRRIYDNSNEEGARLCVDFSTGFEEQADLSYRDYIRLQPAVSYSTEVGYSDFCLTGLDHGTSYQLELLPGLPVTAERKLTEVFHGELETDNRQPMIAFRSAYYVLPMAGERSVPLITTNVERAKLTLQRVNDRNLVSMINSHGLSRLVGNSQRREISDTDGELIWEKKLRITGVLNQQTITAVPLSENWPKPKPGVYVLTAAIMEQGESGDEWLSRGEYSTQWLLVSDVGLFSLQGADGLHLFTRSLQSGGIKSQVRLQLLSRNNEVLAERVSDGNGYAHFAAALLQGTGSLEAAAIMAYAGDDDFNVLDLNSVAHDFSDRGVSGRETPGAVDIFLYTDRGVYRPGEQLHLSGLVRDGKGNARADLPVRVRVVRPDQTEMETHALVADPSGFITLELDLPANSATGNWRLEAFSGSDKVAGKVSFQVEEFAPPRIKVDTKARADHVTANQPLGIDVAATFLHGAAVAGARVQGEAIMKIARHPFPEYDAFQFADPTVEWWPQHIELQSGETDAQGHAQMTLNTETPDLTVPLEVAVRISVFEPGGRPVQSLMTKPLLYQQYAVGIRPHFSGDVLQPGASAEFDLLILEHGAPAYPAVVEYRLVRELHQGHWVYEGSAWKYEESLSDGGIVKSGRLDVSPQGMASLRLDALTWGRYRLEALTADGKVRSAYQFPVGWYGSGKRRDIPDKLTVALDREKYQIGERALLNIEPKFSGPAVVTVAGSQLYEQQQIELVAGQELSIPLHVNAAWKPGVYVMVTAFRAGGSGRKQAPDRAIGLVYLQTESRSQQLSIDIETPPRVRPGETIRIPLQVSGSGDEAAYITLAAVDEGVLRLSDFKTPDPRHHYLGRRRMGLEVKDLYGRLIRPEGVPGSYEVGGDSGFDQRQALGVRPDAVVALYSGKLDIDANGRAVAEIPLPDYQGELRLMAVAWTRHATGSSDKLMKVVAPVRAELYLPHFLASEDQAQVRLRIIHSDEAQSGRYHLRVSSSQPLGVQPLDLDLDNTSQQGAAGVLLDQKIALQAGREVGVGSINIEIEQPDGTTMTQQWQLAVRASAPMVYQRHITQLPAGERFDPVAVALKSGISYERSAALSLQSQPLLGVDVMRTALDDYAYRCAEQTTSRAFAHIVPAAGDPQESSVENAESGEMIEEAVQRLLAQQSYKGGFTLWREGDPELWISAYVMDYLLQVREAGHNVPQEAVSRGLRWIKEQLRRWDDDAQTVAADAYALYVLERAGKVVTTDLRYYSDNKLQQLESPMGAAFIGAALSRRGDHQRAVKAFERARQLIRQPDDVPYAHFGGYLRDLAAVLALKAESSELDAQWLSWYSLLAEQAAQRDYLSTQEQAWMIRAASSVDLAPAAMELQIGESAATIMERYEQQARGSKNLPVVSNQGEKSVWAELALRGVVEEPMATPGYQISRRFYTLDGKPADLSTVAHNARLIAVIEGVVPKSDKSASPMVVDLLPAGLELENPQLSGFDLVSSLSWIGSRTRTQHQEYRDDRYLAVLDEGVNTFRLSYVVRAITPGSFRVPPILIEDMYRPERRAVSTMGELTIKP
ncbi:MAG: alpha-2-macroglobulin family protein [Gammaproteobacteria bacterium]|nr:alpha-2-macroglobulin family protein [Gammaproteobacteria bacterium]